MVPVDKLIVHLDGNTIGTFTFSSGQVRFEYIDSGEMITPISLSMPRSSSKHSNKNASAFLWGLLPDNPDALSNMAAEAGTSANSLSGLLRHVGADVAGALQILPPGVDSDDAHPLSLVQEPSLTDQGVEELMRAAVDKYTGRQPGGGQSFRFSLAGAQAKIALSRKPDGQWATPNPRIATTHILKPVRVGDRSFVSEIDLVEQLTLGAARELGLDAARSEVWTAPTGDLTALVVDRFDRWINDEGIVKRDHQEDLLQALGVPPEKKYQHLDGGPGVGMAAQLFRNKVAPSQRGAVAEAFFKGLVFNVGILGTDAHAKNYSLLLKDQSVHLAPLYDLISAGAHMVDTDSLTFPMAINGEYKFTRIGPADLVKEGRRLGLSGERSTQLVEQILAGIPAALERSAVHSGHQELGERMMEGINQISPARYFANDR